MTDLVRLVYASRPVRPLTPDAMGRLMESARAFNEANEITGCLLSISEVGDDPTAYVQWIEGAGNAIKRCFERIVQDPRHTDVWVLDVSPISERAYPEWTMRGETVPHGTVDDALARLGIEASA